MINTDQPSRDQLLEEFEDDIDIEQLAFDWYWSRFNKAASSYMGTFIPSVISEDYDEDDAADFAAEAAYRFSLIRDGEGKW